MSIFLDIYIGIRVYLIVDNHAYEPSLCCVKLEPLTAPKISRSMEAKYEF